MFTIRYMKCGRKWRMVAHEGGRKWGVLLYIQRVLSFIGNTIVTYIKMSF